MNFTEQLNNIVSVFADIWFIVANGGWVLLVLMLVYLLYVLYIDEIQGQYLAKQEWVFLSIRVPRINQLSTVAVEQIFSQMHAMHTNYTFAERYVEGRINLWYSLEIVSLGGKISYIVRTPKRLQGLVQAAFYAQYPDAEIAEVNDYMENLEFHPGHSDFDIFGFEFKVEEDQTLPIKTYKEFEHPTAETKIIDPLSPLFESLGSMDPHEMYAVQIVINPLGDNEWKPISEAKAEALTKGEEEHHSSFNILSFLLGLFAGGGGHAEATENKQERTFMQLSDIEKERINGVLRKAGKPGYKTKIRHLYLAPIDKFDKSKKFLPIGAYRTLGSANTNKLKPDVKRTWTAKDYRVSPTLEKVYLDFIVHERKEHFFKGFKNRSMYIGIDPFILNVEELATIYHLPLIAEDATSLPAVEAIETKKAQPPANLPIGEY